MFVLKSPVMLLFAKKKIGMLMKYLSKSLDITMDVCTNKKC